MITPADEVLITQYHDTKLSVIGGIGRVIPGPVYFEDKREFLSTWNAALALDTQLEQETELVKFCSFSFVGFEDDPESSPHSPIITLTYELYIFREYGLERVDENAAVTTTVRRMLKGYQEFVSTVLLVKAAYQREASLGVLNAIKYVEQVNLPMFQLQDRQSRGECEFIPDVFGHIGEYELGVRVQLKEC